MIQVKVMMDRKAEKAIKKLMPRKQYEKARKYAIRRALTQTYTAGNRAITARYKIKMGDVRALSVVNKYQGYISYGEGVKGRMLTTAHFRVTPTVSQAAKRRSSKRRHKLTIIRTVSTGWFMIPGKPAKVLWERTGPGRTDVQPVKAISIAQMASDEVLQTMQSTMVESYNKRFEYECNKILKKAGFQ